MEIRRILEVMEGSCNKLLSSIEDFFHPETVHGPSAICLQYRKQNQEVYGFLVCKQAEGDVGF